MTETDAWDLRTRWFVALHVLPTLLAEAAADEAREIEMTETDAWVLMDPRDYAPPTATTVVYDRHSDEWMLRDPRIACGVWLNIPNGSDAPTAVAEAARILPTLLAEAAADEAREIEMADEAREIEMADGEADPPATNERTRA